MNNQKQNIPRKQLQKQREVELADAASLKGQALAKGLKRIRKLHTLGDTLADDIGLKGFELARGLRDLLR